MKSKVTSAAYVLRDGVEKKTWSNDKGTFYFVYVQFENGDQGEYMTKSDSQTKFVVGQEAEYTKEANQNSNFPDKIKPAQTFGGGSFGGKALASPRAMSMSYAKDIVCKMMEVHGKAIAKKEIDLLIPHFADLCHGWVEQKETVVKPAEAKPIQQTATDKTVKNDDDDLPF